MTQCATSMIVWMTRDPTRMATGTMHRAVSVSWLAHPGGGDAEQIQRTLGWSGIPHLGNEDLLLQWEVGVPAQDVTEQAAIAALALLIHDLGQGEILGALSIGSGGDYLVKLVGVRNQVQAESSGVREDRTGVESRSRLTKKKTQVLSKSAAGFAAVTTFHHPPDGVVQCYLHYVCQPGGKKPSQGKRRK